MTDIVKGMYSAYQKSDSATNEGAMRAALLWYATQLESEGKHFVAGEVRAAAGGDK